MRGNRAGLLLLAGLALGLMAAVEAPDPKTIIQDRQGTMKGFAAKIKVIKAYADGEGDQAEALAAAKAIEETAPRIPSFFPPGTGTAVPGILTHAKPEIWSDREKFEGTAMRLAGQVKSLVAAIDAGDRNGTKEGLAAAGRVGCGACHEIFRAPLD